MINRRIFLGGLVAATAASAGRIAYPEGLAAATARSLDDAFKSPPADARPWVYWFWINGNLSKQGITADLEAMQRVGIGGVLIMEVDGSPQGKIAFGTDAWREMFLFACQEASRCGIEINMNNDAGWAGSGGPWNTPENSMQRVLWSETAIDGGRRFDGALEQPKPQTSGRPPATPPPDYYREIAVLAFPTPADDSHRIADIAFKANFQARSTPPGLNGGIPLLPIDFETVPANAVVDTSRVLDITEHYSNGRLTWNAPPGRWTVMRFGHGSTGTTNHPCPPAGQGLECDKLSKAAVETHFQFFIGELLKLIGPLGGKTLLSTHVDSWEVGTQNWTLQFREEFRERRGYDVLPYLPVLSGRVLGSSEISERFLYDLRKTVSDMIAENYFGHLRTLAKAAGLRLSAEPYDGDPLDEMISAAQLDEPQTEFWYRHENQPLNEAGDFGNTLRSYSWAANMASAAHTNGKRILASEAFTAMPGENWLGHPATLKPLGDWAFCAGINRFIFHRYAMQPFLDRKPGMTMAFWGQHYERTQTWWEESKDWHLYLTRCQHMLRQGLFVADLLYLEGEAAPNRFMPPGVDMKNPVPPDTPGYNYDGCAADVVFNRVAIKDGRIVLPDGMSYRMMVLPERGEQVQAGLMTPELLLRIESLVKQGMTLVGPPPVKSPSLVNYPACDQNLKSAVDRLWGSAPAAVGDRRVGSGRVVWGRTPQQVLAAMNVPVDFSSGNAAPFRYIHRRADDGTEIYFVANKNDKAVEALCSFRVKDRRPELWWPESGRIEKPALYDHAGEVTNVPLRLDQFGSVFVIFRGRPEVDRVTTILQDGQPLAVEGKSIELRRDNAATVEALIWQPGQFTIKHANGKSRDLHVAKIPAPLTLAGGWDVRFAPNWGAPAEAHLPQLISWSEHADEGIRYFSGHATYSKHIEIPAEMVAKKRALYLDLGEVAVIATVKLNGQDMGTLWRAPYIVDISDAARFGQNTLEVTVVNLWPNRIIGDAHLPEDCEWNPQPTRVLGGPVNGKQPMMQSLKAFPQWLLDGKPSPTGRYTFSIIRVWSKDAPLQTSGLIGPVRLISAVRESIALV